MSFTSSNTIPQGFSVYQPMLGAPLQFFPVLGSKELDDMVNACVPGPASIKEKRATISVDFLDYTQRTGQNFKFYTVPDMATSFTDSPTSASPSQPSASVSSLSNSPATSHWDWSPSWDWSSVSGAASSQASASGRSSSKPSASNSRRQTNTDFSHLPGMKILTKDGVDVTNSAARGSKTKEQRDHAHLMRIIKACDSCKKKKIRCDPSHKKRGASSTAQPQPTTKSQKKAKTSPQPSIPVSIPDMAPMPELALPDLDPNFDFSDMALDFSDAALDFTGFDSFDWDFNPEGVHEAWEDFIHYPPAGIQPNASLTLKDLEGLEPPRQEPDYNEPVFSVAEYDFSADRHGDLVSQWRTSVAHINSGPHVNGEERTSLNSSVYSALRSTWSESTSLSPSTDSLIHSPSDERTSVSSSLSPSIGLAVQSPNVERSRLSHSTLQTASDEITSVNSDLNWSIQATSVERRSLSSGVHSNINSALQATVDERVELNSDRDCSIQATNAQRTSVSPNANSDLNSLAQTTNAQRTSVSSNDHSVHGTTAQATGDERTSANMNVHSNLGIAAQATGDERTSVDSNANSNLTSASRATSDQHTGISSHNNSELGESAQATSCEKRTRLSSYLTSALRTTGGKKPSLMSHLHSMLQPTSSKETTLTSYSSGLWSLAPLVALGSCSAGLWSMIPLAASAVLLSSMA